MIVAGIDEAGYGPMLGPLVVSGVAFSLPDKLADADLWDVLNQSIARSASKRDHRLPIADSKKLFNRKDGLLRLERTALVMLRVAGRSPKTLRGLLKIASPRSLGPLADYPWYADLGWPIPTSTTPGDLATRANAVRRDLARLDVQLTGLFTELLPEGHFNRRVTQTRNKAVVLLEMTLSLVQRILDHGAGRSVRIHVDRQGGRQHYAERLMTFFDGCALRILDESDTRSAYQLTHAGRSWSIEFITSGETHRLPVALASVYSKYLRELLMDRFNAYFSQRVEGLTPTAGYYTDALRFLADIAPAIRAEKLDKSTLVRSR